MSRRKKKRAEVRHSNVHAAPAWQFFPLYGLVIEKDDGLTDPMFGDATLVAPGSLATALVASGNELHPLFLHQPLANVLADLDWPSIGPRENLVEIAPQSFIAVRFRSDLEASKRRAETICALLTATMFFRGTRLSAFAMEPHDFAWYIAPSNVVVHHGKPAQAQVRVLLNEHVVNKAIRVEKAHLRESWKTGSVVPTPEPLAWDLHSEHPVCRLLAAQRHHGRGLDLVNTALHLQGAMCAVPYAIQLQMAVTAIERLAYTSEFKKIPQRVLPFFPDEKQRRDLEEVLKARHRIVHDGWRPTDEDAKRLAREALTIAWLLFDISVGFFDALGSREQYERLLDINAGASQLAESIDQLLGTGSGNAVRSANDQVQRNLSCRLTLRVKWEQPRNANEAENREEGPKPT